MPRKERNNIQFLIGKTITKIESDGRFHKFYDGDEFIFEIDMEDSAVLDRNGYLFEEMVRKQE